MHIGYNGSMRIKSMLKMGLALLVACCVALPCVSFAGEAQGDGTQVCRALLVGCDQFLTESETTPIAHNNIQMMESMLKLDTRGFLIRRLDGVATGADSLKAAVDWAFAGADEDDISLVYISTHGSFDSGRTLPEGTLLFSDGTMEEEVGAQTLESLLAGIPGQKVLLVDACSSGALIGKGVSPSVGSARVRAAFRGDDFHVLVSAGANELSWYWQADTEEAPPGASYFTAALVAGAGLYGTYSADQNSDGTLTLREMYTYLRTGQPSSGAQAYPQEDDFPLICYDPGAAVDQTLGELTGIVFQRTALDPKKPSVTLYYTATVTTRVAYSVTPYKNGRWDWEHATLIPDTTEWDDAANPSGQVFPGRRLSEVDLTDVLPEGWQYAMIHVLTLSGVDDNSAPSAVYAGRVLRAEVDGDPELSIRATSSWRRAVRPELEIFIGHTLPLNLTVTIEDASGRTIKTLAAAASTRPESLTPEGSLFYWNGTLRSGEAAPAGEYSIHATAVVGGQPYSVTKTVAVE